MNPLRRGACPSIADPMLTGDGLLARLMPPAPMPLDAFMALCNASQTHGNGIMEVTQRGSFQVRGLSSDSAPLFARTAAALGLGAKAGPAILAPPLYGLDGWESIELSRFSAALRAELGLDPAAKALGPKVSVLIDGRSALHLDDVPADLRLRAASASRFHLSLGGYAAAAVSLGWVEPHHAIKALAHVLTAIARRGQGARARDFANDAGREALRAALAGMLTEEAPPPPRPRAEPIATHRLSDGRVARGIALAFGFGETGLLERVAHAAARCGAASIRPAPGRALLLIGMTAAGADDFAAAAAAEGCVIQPDDARRHVVACAGAPACAYATLSTRPLAAGIAQAATRLLDGSLTIHVSGCSKGCAHSGAAALTVVGPDRLIVQGRACDPPHGRIAAANLLTHIARLEAQASESRLAHELSADWLSRLGARRVIESLGGELTHADDYLRDGARIYERSFAIIRAEADLSRFSDEEADVAVRMVHACGMVEAAASIVFAPGVVAAARRALRAGAAILCDSEMVSHGITRDRLPAENTVICTLRDPAVPALAAKLATTRSAAALELWADRLEGAVIAIGNAPTCLFRLLDMLDETPARPAAILGIPVGFVGAEESKEALIANPRGVPFITVRGRLGGSALTAAALNGLARAGL